MSVPAPPTVEGIDKSTSYTTGNGFYDTLFNAYRAISPKYTKSLPGDNLQHEMTGIKNLPYDATFGLSLDLARNVSSSFQVKHMLKLPLKGDNRSSHYIAQLQLQKDYEQVTSHLWKKYHIVNFITPSTGELRTVMGTSLVLTQEADAPKPHRSKANNLRMSVGVRTFADATKREEGFIDSASAGLSSNGSDISWTYRAGDAFQLKFVQNLTKRTWVSIGYFMAHPISGLDAAFRLEGNGKENGPKDVYTATVNGNTLNGLSALGLSYSRLYSENFQWHSDVSLSQSQNGPEVNSSTGIEYTVLDRSMMSKYRCSLNHNGSLLCIINESLSPLLSYSLTAAVDLMQTTFSFGVGLECNMDP